MIGLTGLITDPVQFAPKINRIMNLFAAIGNMFIGLFIPMKQNEQNTGVYQSMYGYTGLILFFIGTVTYVYSLHITSKRLGIISLFVLWGFIFYIPNWFSEPRAPMAATHRYLFLSSIGFIALLGYGLSKLKP
jgi:hypothetical protein